MAGEPDWNAAGHLEGLPVTHWKRRTGFTERGTVADLIQRWLGLPWNLQQECSLGWGPNAAGQHGSLSRTGIGSYVLRHGLPPKMSAARQRAATPQEIEAMFTKPVMREGPPAERTHSTP